MPCDLCLCFILIANLHRTQSWCTVEFWYQRFFSPAWNEIDRSPVSGPDISERGMDPHTETSVVSISKCWCLYLIKTRKLSWALKCKCSIVRRSRKFQHVSKTQSQRCKYHVYTGDIQKYDMKKIWNAVQDQTLR